MDKNGKVDAFPIKQLTEVVCVRKPQCEPTHKSLLDRVKRNATTTNDRIGTSSNIKLFEESKPPVVERRLKSRAVTSSKRSTSYNHLPQWNQTFKCDGGFIAYRL